MIGDGESHCNDEWLMMIAISPAQVAWKVDDKRGIVISETGEKWLGECIVSLKMRLLSL